VYFCVQRNPAPARRSLQAAANLLSMFALIRSRLTIFVSAILLASYAASGAANWQRTLSKEPAGNFPELRPLHAFYRFGWSGLTAATGEVHFTKPSNARFQLEGTGRTSGLVRALWKLDVNYRAVADAATLKPIETQQTENYRSKRIVTDLTFTNSGVTRARTEGQGSAARTKTKQFVFPNLFDLHSAALYLRSQRLEQGSVYRLVVYPGTNAYLTTVTVIGNFVAPQSGCQTMPNGSSCGSRPRFSSAQCSPNCSRCISTLQSSWLLMRTIL
jgi:hypothetical protein